MAWSGIQFSNLLSYACLFLVNIWIHSYILISSSGSHHTMGTKTFKVQKKSSRWRDMVEEQNLGSEAYLRWFNLAIVCISGHKKGYSTQFDSIQSS